MRPIHFSGTDYSSKAELMRAKRGGGFVKQTVTLDPMAFAKQQNEKNKMLVDLTKQQQWQAAIMSLEAGADINTPIDNDRNTLLMYVIHYRRKDIFDEVMRRNPKPLLDLTNTKGETALYWACGKGFEEFITPLVKAGANMEIASKEQRNPLYIACKEGHGNCANILINLGAKVNPENPRAGWTPLHLAAQTGLEETARLLINKGAAKYAKNDEGQYPVQVAKSNLKQLLQ